MSRLYDTIEPTVIDEVLLQQCVEEQGPKGEAGKIAKQEGIDFGDVLELRLDFKNILKIDNMWMFRQLTKLQLDNNIIEKIEGLDMLVHLEWLDLSFNNIEEISGLDSLTQLKDLTLYNNRIEKLENMDNLHQLHVFSIGNNKLQDKENLLYLRRFKSLTSLNLGGNPFCSEYEHKDYVVAHLSTLVYLDYRLVDETFRETAMERYRYAIEELAHDEQQAERKMEEERASMEERMLHKEGYVEDLNTNLLFESMFSEDPEAEKLAQLPGVKELLDEYEEKFVDICGKLFEFGMKERSKRKDELDSFLTALYDATENNKNASVKLLNEYEQYKTKEMQLMLTQTDHDMLDQQTTEMNEAIAKLQNDLMGLELQLVDQLEESIKDFERNMSDMVSFFVENVQGLISQCRDLENNHHEKISDIAVVTLEKLMKNELEEEIPDDLRMLFVDRDTIMNAVSASHDAHLFKIDNKEDEMVTRANSTCQTLIERLHGDEVTRNRTRVREITNLLDHAKEDLYALEGHLG